MSLEVMINTRHQNWLVTPDAVCPMFLAKLVREQHQMMNIACDLLILINSHALH